jgi:ribonucleotide reductase alpha subunit
MVNELMCLRQIIEEFAYPKQVAYHQSAWYESILLGINMPSFLFMSQSSGIDPSMSIIENKKFNDTESISVGKFIIRNDAFFLKNRKSNNFKFAANRIGIYLIE